MNTLRNNLKTFWKSELRWPVIIAILIAFGVGYIFRGGAGSSQTQMQPETDTVAQNQVWTCSMHPQIRQPKSGQCPICGMDLIPVSAGGQEETGPRELKLSPNAVKLAEIQTAPVERKYVNAEIRMVGKVEYDETRLGYISAWVPGRIDRLYVDYTGTSVRKGDHLVYIYSPELITAQQELIQTVKTLREVKAGMNPNVLETAMRTAQAVREKLLLWGLTEEQIHSIEQKGEPTDHLTIYSPMSGVVIHRNATEGMYVDTGTKIYTIADLTKVWVKLDAYESDLEWIRYGQEVEFETEAFPGEKFHGKIAFVDPVLNPQTRTVKVRVNVDNPTGKLKPEMFVRAVVRSKLSVSGKVMDPALAGKWISPMHPEIVKDHPGKCDVCGMPLVRAEKLGYVPANAMQKDAPLVIPASAPLITGKRAVVYVEVPGKESVYEGREVVLGPRAGDYYLVREGLQEGEQVVTNGNFKLDSDLQIKAKPSMMSPPEDKASRQQYSGNSSKTPEHAIENFPAPAPFRESLRNLTSAYLAIQKALSRDNLAEAQTKVKHFRSLLEKIDMKLLKNHAHSHWMELQKPLDESSQALMTATQIDGARRSFDTLSEKLYAAIKQFGIGEGGALYRYYCPMAFDNRGAYWLQSQQEVENPYFGSAMFRCGEQVEAVSQNDGDHKHD